MNVIVKNIYCDIYEISDLNWQRKLWLNENNDTGLISSFTEVYCRLFDDNCFESFIETTAKEVGMPQELIIELNKLKILLNSYDEADFSDEEIINDPDWKKVSEQAKVVINLWNKTFESPRSL